MDLVNLLESTLEEEDQSSLLLPCDGLIAGMVISDHISTLLMSNILHDKGRLRVDLTFIEGSLEEDA